jgi:dephospho-CoA kinase
VRYPSLWRLVRPLLRLEFERIAPRWDSFRSPDALASFEAGLEREYHPTVVVSCSPAQQEERAARRDNKPTAAIQARIAAQMPLAAKVSRADYVIDNGGGFEATRLNADRVLAAICAELGVDPARYFAPQT